MFPGGLAFGYGSRGYGNLQLSEATPQTFVEPLTIEEVQGFLKIVPEANPDTVEDDLLRGLITAAREQAEILQGRDLVQKQWDLSLDQWPSIDIQLRTPLVSIDLVKYRDSTGAYTTLVDGTDFVTDLPRGVISPVYGRTFPLFAAWPSSAILIRFTSGYAVDSIFWSNAGARLKIGMKLLISHWFNNRLPFEKGAGATGEYPYAVSVCLAYGCVPNVI